MSEQLVNGKHYPMWQSLVDGKSIWIGGRVFNFDMGLKAEATLTDIKLEPNGTDSAKVVFYTAEDPDEPWCFDVSVGGIGSNYTGEPGLCISTAYCGSFVLQEPTEAKS